MGEKIGRDRFECQKATGIQSARPRDQLIHSLALGTGLRLAEIAGLNVEDSYAPEETPTLWSDLLRHTDHTCRTLCMPCSKPCADVGGAPFAPCRLVSHCTGCKAQSLGRTGTPGVYQSLLGWGCPTVAPSRSKTPRPVHGIPGRFTHRHASRALLTSTQYRPGGTGRKRRSNVDPVPGSASALITALQLVGATPVFFKDR